MRVRVCACVVGFVPKCITFRLPCFCSQALGAIQRPHRSRPHHVTVQLIEPGVENLMRLLTIGPTLSVAMCVCASVWLCSTPYGSDAIDLYVYALHVR